MSNGIQVAEGEVTEYYQEVKMPIIAGYDVARLYFDTAEMKRQVGCQRMERVLTPNPMPWTRPQDQMPKDDTPVLITDVLGRQIVAWWRPAHDMWYSENYSWFTREVVYWMPIPQPPKP